MNNFCIYLLKAPCCLATKSGADGVLWDPAQWVHRGGLCGGIDGVV